MKTAPRAVAALTLVWAAACGSEGTAPALRVSLLDLRHSTRAVPVGGQITIEALGFDQHGARITLPRIDWTSDDALIASVDSLGRVTGTGIGAVTIRATSGHVQGEIRIHVRAASLSLVVVGGSSNLIVGESLVLRAQFQDVAGNPIASPSPFRWSTADSFVVRLDPAPGRDDHYAMVTGLRAGLAFISAGADDVRNTYAVGVLFEPEPLDAPLIVRDFHYVSYLDDIPAFVPNLEVTVKPGRSVEIVRVEVSLPGTQMRQFLMLCSEGGLAAGTHTLLGANSYPYGLVTWSRSIPAPGTDGVALLTYRTDTGRLIQMTIRGELDPWGYGRGYWSEFPWEECN